MRLHDFKKKKQELAKIPIVTCYDCPSARIVAQSDIDVVLVGDSLAMAVHGHTTTVTATIDMMVLHTQAVARGLTNQFLITDLPFLCHKVSKADTMRQVRKLMQAGSQAVKIEGGDADTCTTIAYLITAGIPVMGHIGLTPQSIYQLGGYKVQGRSSEQGDMLLQQAKALEKAGCFALVLECIPQDLAKTITKSLQIPTIGIGAGVHTDGQVLVWHDLLGMQSDINLRFVKQFAKAESLFLEALNAYAAQVVTQQFPATEHSFERNAHANYCEA